MKQVARILGSVAIIGVVAACASAGTGRAGDPNTGGAGSTTGSTADQNISASGAVWPIKTREHVDLWLHGYAMLQEDTTFVPFFRRGYSTNMTVLKNRANVISQLDANRDRLRARLSANPGLINAQFIPLSFSSWNEIVEVVNFFVRADGDPRAASSQQQANAIAFLAAYFPSAADREWVRLFVTSLADERARFYGSYWAQQQREKRNVLDEVDVLWQGTYRPKIQRFLNNTQQAAGDVLLSLPLNGEGRSQSSGKQANVLTVTFPDRPADAIEAIYVIAHEAVGTLANTAVIDNITPEQRRTGLGERYTSAAAVRSGALLLQRAAPEALDGYMRYYLRSVN
ncbi:MAG: hypothetical protein M3365_03355, partial [Gemmatimonadota bacterium]|nr:hypothetical protein [Gemmatimonadota bacterium]